MSHYVKEVTSSLKNHTGTVVLGPKTLILGRNKGGKSAIVNALEIALTATASDLVGRALVKEVNRLMSASREDSIYARCVLDDDGVVEVKTKGKKLIWTSQPATYNPTTVFPLRNVREALAGNPETTRRFFIRFVAGAVTDADVLNEIPRPLHARYQQALASTPKTAAVDMLLAGLASAKERVSALRSEIATRKEITQEAGTGMAPPPTAAQLQAAEEAVQRAQQACRAMEIDLTKEQQRENQRIQFTNLRARQEEIQQQLDEKRSTLANAQENWPPQPATTDNIRTHHLAVLRYAQAGKLAQCPTCKTHLGDGAPDLWTLRVQTVEAAATAATERVRAFEAHKALVSEVEMDIDVLMADHERNATALEALGEMPEPMDIASFEMGYDQAKAELDAARDNVRKLEQAKAAWEPIYRARDSAAQKEVEFDEWTRLVTALQAAVGALLDKARDTFVARVQAFLPEGDTFSLVLHDEDREVCQYGFLRDGRLQEALSGVEWAYVTAAIAAAAIPDNEKGHLHIIVFEDRAWDLDTMRGVMAAVANLEAQVIIATTPPMDWDGNLPAGWTLVDLSGDLDVEAAREALADGAPVSFAHQQPGGPPGLEDDERNAIEVRRLAKELEKAHAEINALKAERRKAGEVEDVAEIKDGRVVGWKETPTEKPPRKPRAKKEKAPPAPPPDLAPELE